MPRPTVAKIDLDAIRHNFRIATERAGDSQAMAVIKADGYGHGITRVAQALAGEAGRFAVACIEEAQAVRAAGLSHPVVLLQGVHQAVDLPVCVREGFEPVLHSRHQLDWLQQQRQLPVFWIKVNTGMNRLGFRPEELADVMAGLGERPEFRGFVTHFASADEFEHDSAERQTARFIDAVKPWPDAVLSISNSAGHFRAGQRLFHLSRPGIMLYGSSPMAEQDGTDLGLRPAMSLESELIAVRTLAAGDCVGYGESWKAGRPTPMGIVAVGYGDGYPRHAGSGTPVLVNGRRAPLIGRVSMDMLAVDLSGVPGAVVGDPVELWGTGLSVDEVARCAGTISYELLTGVTARVPRLYTGS